MIRLYCAFNHHTKKKEKNEGFRTTRSSIMRNKKVRLVLTVSEAPIYYIDADLIISITISRKLMVKMEDNVNCLSVSEGFFWDRVGGWKCVT